MKFSKAEILFLLMTEKRLSNTKSCDVTLVVPHFIDGSIKEERSMTP